MENQLTLELGILTNEQQEKVNYFVRNKKSITERLISDQSRIEGLLIEGGFKAGIDYVNDFKYGVVTENVTIGWGEDAFEAEVTYMKSSGGCKILFDRYNSALNTVEVGMSIVSHEHDRLECSAITTQYRAYKPSSLLAKLKENNEKAQNKYNSVNREKLIIDYTVNKYKTLFPKSTVTVGTDYYKSGNTYKDFKTVIVSFESGSYVIFRLGYENDKEYTHKKFDAVASKLSAIELLNVFNNQ